MIKIELFLLFVPYNADILPFKNLYYRFVWHKNQCLLCKFTQTPICFIINLSTFYNIFKSAEDNCRFSNSFPFCNIPKSAVFIRVGGQIVPHLRKQTSYSSTSLGTHSTISTGSISKLAVSFDIARVTTAARVFIGFFWSKMKLPML